MNRFLPGVLMLSLTGLFCLPELVEASDALQLAQSLPGSANNNPYNSPIRRANPNSMQGTQPNAPVIRGPNTVPVQRAPTLDNGGIGNRYPAAATPASPPKFIPNPPHRDADTSNP